MRKTEIENEVGKYIREYKRNMENKRYNLPHRVYITVI